MSELFGSAEAGDYSLADLDDLSQAQTTFDTGSDEQAEANIQSVLANVGNRSNIRGSVNYDPLFAQAFNMSNRLQPGNLVAGDYYGANKFQGIADLARPSYLQPQIRGADGKMYFSKGKVKIELAVAKGKKLYDKRQVKKTRDWNREKARLLSKNNK